MEMMCGGSVIIKSCDNKGTKVIITIPIAARSKKAGKKDNSHFEVFY